jgi:hypothetical protein
MRHPPAALLLATVTVLAGPVDAREEGGWILQANAAAASIDDRPTQFFWGVRLGGAVNERGTLVVDFGYGTAAGDFSVLDAGVEYRTPPGKRFGGFVRLEVGRLSEDFGNYLFLGAGAGVLVRVAPRLYFRAGVILGTHGPAEGRPKGPILYQGGLELRF